MAKGKHNGNGHGHVTETPDTSHIKNIDVTHEASDVSLGGILKFIVGLTVFGVVVSILMWGLFRFFNSQEVQNEPQPGPMAMSKEERLPPEPRLQSAPGFGVKMEDGKWVPLEKREPQAEYRVLREQWDRKLNCQEAEAGHHEGVKAVVEHPAEPKAEDRKQICIPIEEAIQRIVDQKMPTRNASEAGQDIALPTAASSGRVTGKGNRP